MSVENLVQEIITCSNIDSRPYQTRIVTKVLKMFEGLHCNGAGELEPAARSVMIESPTGSGKSCMGLLAAKALQVQAGIRVGWVSMRRNLSQQVQAENSRHGVNVDLQTISMFEKNPPADIDLLIIDECVPGDTLLDVEVNGQREQVRIDDVVLNSVGSSVLSYSDDGDLEYQPIISRSPMGRKELVEVTVEVEGEETVLLITEEGRVWTDEGYRKPLELLGSTVLCKTSRCQTYLYGQRTTRRSIKVRSDPAGQDEGRSAVCLRMWSEGALVSSPEEIQNLSVQSPPTKGLSRSDKDATTDYPRDTAGRRVSRVRMQSPDWGKDECSAQNSALYEPAVGICTVEACGHPSTQQSAADSREPWLWERSRRVQHAVSPVHPEKCQSALHTTQDCDAGLSGSLRRTGVCGVVDGRRIDNSNRDACIHSFGEQIDRLGSGIAGGSTL